MNKYAAHVFVIPEDEADRQIADGFVLHHQVEDARIRVMPPAGGWPKVRATFQDEYVLYLNKYSDACIVMLIDFDGKINERRAAFEAVIPANLKNRVFVIGPKHNPEQLRKELSNSFEEIGKSLANDCVTGSNENWAHEHLVHNEDDRQRMVKAVKPFLFKGLSSLI